MRYCRVAGFYEGMNGFSRSRGRTACSINFQYDNRGDPEAPEAFGLHRSSQFQGPDRKP